MDIDDFIKRYKQAKRGSKATANIVVHIIVQRDDRDKIIINRFICRHCKSEITNGIKIKFFKEHKLTIFESGMLYYLFCENKIPQDYAQWHKCQAGKEFIANIENIEVV